MIHAVRKLATSQVTYSPFHCPQWKPNAHVVRVTVAGHTEWNSSSSIRLVAEFWKPFRVSSIRSNNVFLEQVRYQPVQSVILKYIILTTNMRYFLIICCHRSPIILYDIIQYLFVVFFFFLFTASDRFWSGRKQTHEFNKKFALKSLLE